MSNRIGKAFTENSQTTYTLYVRDAQGNAYYLENGLNAPQPTSNTLYGISPELAELNIDFETYSTICGFSVNFEDQYAALIKWTNPSPSTSYFYLGNYSKQPETGKADYRYGFNGKEKDNDIIGKGRWQDYGMRMYRPDLGRFFSVDPIGKRFPYFTPYQYAANTPIVAIDLDGLEDVWVHNFILNDGTIVTLTIYKNDENYESTRKSLANSFGFEVSDLPNDGVLSTLSDAKGKLIRKTYSDTPEITAFRESALSRLMNKIFKAKKIGNEDVWIKCGNSDGANMGTPTPGGKEAVSDGLGYTALGFKIIGTTMVLGGVTSALGGTMILFGEGMDLLSDGISIENDMRKGKYENVANTAIWTIAGFGVGGAVKEIKGIDNASKELLNRTFEVGAAGAEKGVDKIIDDSKSK